MYLSKKYGSSPSPSKFNTIIHGQSLLQYTPTQQTTTPISSITIDTQKAHALSRNLFLPYSYKKRTIDRKVNSIILQRKAISRSKVQPAVDRQKQKEKEKREMGSKEISFPEIIKKKLSYNLDKERERERQKQRQRGEGVRKRKEGKSFQSWGNKETIMGYQQQKSMIIPEWNSGRNCEILKCSRSRKSNNKNRSIQLVVRKKKSQGDLIMTKHGWRDEMRESRDMFGMTKFFS